MMGHYDNCRDENCGICGQTLGLCDHGTTNKPGTCLACGHDHRPSGFKCNVRVPSGHCTCSLTDRDLAAARAEIEWLVYTFTDGKLSKAGYERSVIEDEFHAYVDSLTTEKDAEIERLEAELAQYKVALERSRHRFHSICDAVETLGIISQRGEEDDDDGEDDA